MAAAIQPVQQANAQQDLSILLEDPITNERLVQPMMDRCGHTFSLATVDSIAALNGGRFVCPMSRPAYRVTTLVPNRAIEQILAFANGGQPIPPIPLPPPQFANHLVLHPAVLRQVMRDTIQEANRPLQNRVSVLETSLTTKQQEIDNLNLHVRTLQQQNTNITQEINGQCCIGRTINEAAKFFKTCGI